MEAAETFRLFIAIPVPDAVKDEVEKAQSELQGALPEGAARWTPREQFHLTLRFLGEVDASRVPSLVSALEYACRPFAALALRAERIGCFPDLRFPRVVWAWVHDDAEQLPKLQAAVESAAKPFTVEAAEKKFTGHITLARCQRIKRPQAEAIAKLAHGMTNRVFGHWTADRVEVVRSELLPGGPRYTVLAAAIMGKAEG